MYTFLQMLALALGLPVTATEPEIIAACPNVGWPDSDDEQKKILRKENKEKSKAIAVRVWNMSGRLGSIPMDAKFYADQRHLFRDKVEAWKNADEAHRTLIADQAAVIYSNIMRFVDVMMQFFQMLEPLAQIAEADHRKNIENGGGNFEFIYRRMRSYPRKQFDIELAKHYKVSQKGKDAQEILDILRKVGRLDLVDRAESLQKDLRRANEELADKMQRISFPVFGNPDSGKQITMLDNLHSGLSIRMGNTFSDSPAWQEIRKQIVLDFGEMSILRRIVASEEPVTEESFSRFIHPKARLNAKDIAREYRSAKKMLAEYGAKIVRGKVVWI